MPLIDRLHLVRVPFVFLGHIGMDQTHNRSALTCQAIVQSRHRQEGQGEGRGQNGQSKHHPPPGDKRRQNEGQKT